MAASSITQFFAVILIYDSASDASANSSALLLAGASLLALGSLMLFLAMWTWWRQKWTIKEPPKAGSQ
jgi:hypothetical protein